jgi:hypothetical protein
MATKWEYQLSGYYMYDPAPARVLEKVLAELNRLGTEGWEVAGTWTETSGHVHFLLKRPR